MGCVGDWGVQYHRNPIILNKTDLYHIGLIAHLSDLCHISELLLHQSALKHDQHHQSEDGVVPVLIQAPQSHTEHLEHGKC
jgi:hypothetical protein